MCGLAAVNKPQSQFDLKVHLQQSDQWHQSDTLLLPHRVTPSVSLAFKNLISWAYRRYKQKKLYYTSLSCQSMLLNFKECIFYLTEGMSCIRAEVPTMTN